MKKTLAFNPLWKIFSGFFLILISSCANEPKTTKSTEVTANPEKTYKQASPDFNADSAYYFVQKQVDFGPRVTNTLVNKKCGDYLVAQLKKYADKVEEQTTVITNFDEKKLNIRNIIGHINPAADKRILLCTHWDSRPYADQDANSANHTKPILGADDGGSGVGILLELARVLKNKKTNAGVDIVFFDAEDLGKPNYEDSYCLGSQYWAKELKKSGANNYSFGILLDMTGATGAKFIWEGTSMKYAEPVLRKVWDVGVQLGYSSYFYYYQKKGGLTDDHLYVNEIAGIPTIDIIHYTENTESGFPPHWHTMNDNMGVIDRNTLKAVGQTLLEVIYTEK